MNKTSIPKDLPNQKYLSADDGRLYYHISRATLIKVATNANALIHIGRRVLIDRRKLDAYLDNNASVEV